MCVAIEVLSFSMNHATLKNVIRCPYHFWSYNFEGNLVATPHIGGLNKHQVGKI